MPNSNNSAAVNNSDGAAVDEDNNVTVDGNINGSTDSLAMATNRTAVILRRLGTAGGGLCGAAEAAVRL